MATEAESAEKIDWRRDEELIDWVTLTLVHLLFMPEGNTIIFILVGNGHKQLFTLHRFLQ